MVCAAGADSVQRAFTGGSALLKCVTCRVAAPNVNWTFQAVTSLIRKPLVINGQLVDRYRERMRVTRPSDRDLSLEMWRLNESDSGLYICYETGIARDSVQLIVTGDTDTMAYMPSVQIRCHLKQGRL